MTKHLRLTDEEFAELKGWVRGGVDAPRCKVRQGIRPLEVGYGHQKQHPANDHVLALSKGTRGNGCSQSASAPPSQSFFIPGVLPGLNEIVEAAKVRRGSWSKYADMKEAHQAYIVALIRNVKLKPMSLVTIEFLWHEPKRNRDKDNIAAGKKFICDALKVAGVLKNDGWKNIEGFSDHFTVDRSTPGVTVTLREVGRCRSKSRK